MPANPGLEMLAVQNSIMTFGGYFEERTCQGKQETILYYEFTRKITLRANCRETLRIKKSVTAILTLRGNCKRKQLSRELLTITRCSQK